MQYRDLRKRAKAKAARAVADFVGQILPPTTWRVSSMLVQPEPLVVRCEQSLSVTSALTDAVREYHWKRKQRVTHPRDYFVVTSGDRRYYVVADIVKGQARLRTWTRKRPLMSFP